MLIAGPWVSSAIRNQFNLVAGAIGNGIDKGGWETGGTGGGSGSLTDADIVDPVHGTAFAVYSEDDHSLMFYKRKGLPKVGDMLNSRRVTAVYTGFETASYGPLSSDDYIPWAAVAHKVLSAKVIDCGIAPVSIAHWFDYFYSIRVCDLEKLISRNIQSMDGTFYYNSALTSLVLPTSNFDSLCDTYAAFESCDSLTDFDIGGFNLAHVLRAANTFIYCRSLHLDCSDWDAPKGADRTDFNKNAPGVTLPKAWK